MTAEHRFDVFGRPMAVTRTAGGWRAFWLGNEGKRRPADLHVPAGLEPGELATWLADVFHEAATPRHPDVVRRG
ncbi:MAG: DUF7661 family protein [Pseudomonadota bacterium]